MIEDTVAMAQALKGITPFIFFQDDSTAADYFKTLAPEIIAAPQQGTDLGERMKKAFTELFGRGFTEVTIIGTDSPDLPPEYICATFTMLADDHTDVVFGPAVDGGYYLLALKRVWEELFTGLPWSSSGLLAASVAKAKALRLGMSFLPAWHDIDTGADLLRPELMQGENLAVKTRAFLISEHRPGSRHSSDR